MSHIGSCSAYLKGGLSYGLLLKRTVGYFATGFEIDSVASINRGFVLIKGTDLSMS